jgi:uncharacterized Zn-binding protein involved in type VI secretion
MPGFLLHVGATVTCPHTGSVIIISTNKRVLVTGQPVATLNDTYTVAGCKFSVPGPKPQPCVRVDWLQPANRVRINGHPAILHSSIGICRSAPLEQARQGPPTVMSTQVKVRGS